MGSVMDSGYWSEKAMETKRTPCPKAKDGKHDWEPQGAGPSSGGICKLCGASYYWK